jgi:hypothetical protein
MTQEKQHDTTSLSSVAVAVRWLWCWLCRVSVMHRWQILSVLLLVFFLEHLLTDDAKKKKKGVPDPNWVAFNLGIG